MVNISNPLSKLDSRYTVIAYEENASMDLRNVKMIAQLTCGYVKLESRYFYTNELNYLTMLLGY